MKKLPIILNVVLLIAVVILYVLHFSGSNSSTGNVSTNSDSTGMNALLAAHKIVYINIDSVYSNYDMYNDVIQDLQDKVSTSEAKLQSQQKSFEKKVKDFQYKAERQLETRAKLAEMEQSLAQEQQQLLALKNQLQYQLAEEEQVAQRKVLNSIMDYLKSVKKEQSYQFVLGTTFGGNILYANDNLDISKSVIEGLNTKYQADKGEEE